MLQSDNSYDESNHTRDYKTASVSKHDCWKIHTQTRSLYAVHMSVWHGCQRLVDDSRFRLGRIACRQLENTAMSFKLVYFCSQSNAHSWVRRPESSVQTALCRSLPSSTTMEPPTRTTPPHELHLVLHAEDQCNSTECHIIQPCSARSVARDHNTHDCLTKNCFFFKVTQACIDSGSHSVCGCA